MREFILLSLKSKTSPDFNLLDLPAAGRLDLVCRTISNTLWISNDLRRDVILHVVMNGPKSPPKIITIKGETLKGFEYDEIGLAKKIKNALKKGLNLKMNESIEVSPGFFITKNSFESLVKEKVKTSNVYYLHNKGEDILELSINDEQNNVFIFGDYIGLPRATEKLLKQIGAKRLKLGKTMLFASHCPIVVNYVLDRNLSN